MLGMFKDEAGGKQIVEFVGLRAKLYSFKMLMVLKIKNVGVTKNVTKRSIQFDDCRECFFLQEGITPKNECHTKSLS